MKTAFQTQGKDEAAFLRVKQIPRGLLCLEKVERYCLVSKHNENLVPVLMNLYKLQPRGHAVNLSDVNYCGFSIPDVLKQQQKYMWLKAACHIMF